jgi:hypothetical protein
MFSCLHVWGEGENTSLVAFGNRLNQTRAGTFAGLRPRNDGFACEISSASNWDDQVACVLDFVTKLGAELRAAPPQLRCEVSFALHPDDLAQPYSDATFSPRLLRVLEEANVALVLTVYSGAATAGDG